ncbi:hypothetical protein ACG2F4_09820 [Halalkalibaculum sp. DA3122]|uniref:hypothetical protein n=1 Tax=Halalkalibaculum sp. DA384 TaxID=3373606 RepID=UPI003754C35F
MMNLKFRMKNGSWWAAENGSLAFPALVKLTARKGAEGSVKKKSVIFLAERRPLQVKFTSAGDFFRLFFHR